MATEEDRFGLIQLYPQPGSSHNTSLEWVCSSCVLNGNLVTHFAPLQHRSRSRTWGPSAADVDGGQKSLAARFPAHVYPGRESFHLWIWFRHRFQQIHVHNRWLCPRHYRAPQVCSKERDGKCLWPSRQFMISYNDWRFQIAAYNFRLPQSRRNCC
jgi:hypothetical protein